VSATLFSLIVSLIVSVAAYSQSATAKSGIINSVKPYQAFGKQHAREFLALDASSAVRELHYKQIEEDITAHHIWISS
jgi:hypothetical protein